MRSRRVSLVRTTWLVVALFLSLPPAAVRAQTSMTAFLPEMNSHFRLSSDVRLVFDANGYMEYGDLNRAQIWTKPSVHHPAPRKAQADYHSRDG
jgi:hypothetical protein